MKNIPRIVSKNKTQISLNVEEESVSLIRIEEVFFLIRLDKIINS